ncbi:hypothetical protein HPP92_021448 [Vanilla planifolia]|uniref:Uncharacterized protein n=1 Tax=Vanilla planifolia TaxID=51239 RepID=A0A835PVF0_VANPL|nr:hypothetical protein HPP92_021448 [Vanilla planifolia]
MKIAFEYSKSSIDGEEEDSVELTDTPLYYFTAGTPSQPRSRILMDGQFPPSSSVHAPYDSCTSTVTTSASESSRQEDNAEQNNPTVLTPDRRHFSKK